MAEQPLLRLGPTTSDRGKEIALNEIELKINQLIAQVEEGGLVGPHHETHELGGDDEVHLDWSLLLGTPTTLAGYGITDAYTKTEVDSLLDALDFADIDGQLAYSQLPTGGGTWANGGDLSIYGGNFYFGLSAPVTLPTAASATTFAIASSGADTSATARLFYYNQRANADLAAGNEIGRFSALMANNGSGSTTDMQIAQFAFFLGGSGGAAGFGGQARFYTKADNVGGLTERLRINEAGNVGLGATAKLNFDGPAASGDTYVTESSANVLDFVVGGTNPAVRMNAAAVFIPGTNRLIIGNTASVSTATITGSGGTSAVQSQLHGTGSTAVFSAVNWANDATLRTGFLITKSRSAVVGTPGVTLQSGDVIGAFGFAGDDGTDLGTMAAQIRVTVASAPATSRLPGYISFLTAAGSADDDLAEKMRLGNLGNLGLTATAKLYLDGVALTGDTFLTESSANVFNLTVGGVTAFQATTSLNTMPVSALAVGHTANSFVINGGSFTAKAYVRSDNVGSHWGWLNEMQSDTASRVGVFGFLRSRAAGAVSVNGDRIMQISAAGHDGTDYHESASIRAAISGVVASDVVPTDLFFMVGSAAGTLTERLRILSGGDLGITATAKLLFDGVAGTGDTYLTESSANVLDFFSGGINTLRLASASAIVAGILSIQYSTVGGDAVSRIINTASSNDLLETASWRMRPDVRGTGTVGVGARAVKEVADWSTLANRDASLQFFVLSNDAEVTAFTINSALAATFAGSIKSTSPTLGIGYGTGAGGTVTQLTNKATGVTLDKICGQITMNSAALAAGAEVTFTVTCAACVAGDLVIANHVSAGTAGSYDVAVTNVSAGSFKLTVSNWSAGSLSEAIVLGYAIIKGVTA